MAMRRYAARGGDSGVVAYATGPGWIDVRFRDGTVYRYTEASAGVPAVQHMKALAASGQGLSTFISREVRGAYESRRQPTLTDKAR
jgi:hypothetical protein